MRLSSEPPRTRWLVMAAGWLLAAALLFAHVRVLRDYLALIDAQGLRGAPAATTPLRHVVPIVYADTQLWLRHALALQEHDGGRVRFTAIDNAPGGREVHWSSSLVWLIAGAGHVRHALTAEPLPLATERMLPWLNFGLLLAAVIALSAWTAHRAGAAAGLLVTFGMIGHRDFYDGFSPGYVDHHGLITACVFGLVLGGVFMAGGWRRLTPTAGGAAMLSDSETATRRAAIVSALCGATGMWLSAASVIPAIVFLAGGALVATLLWGRAAQREGAIFSAAAWRLWGRVGAGASLAYYLLEYAPAHFALRLEVNHPIYALAWWGGAELVALLSETWLRLPGVTPARPPLRWVWPVLAIAVAPLTLALGGVAVFAVRDPFVGRLSDFVLEGMSLFAAVRHLGWDILWTHLNESLLPLGPAVALIFLRGVRDRLTLGLTVGMTAGFLALAFYELRFWQNTSGPQIALTLVALVALVDGRSPRVRWLLTLGVIAGLFLPPALHRVWLRHDSVQRRVVSSLDLAPALHRDIAATIRSSQPTGEVVLLACPTTSTSVSYYGRFQTVGTLYWENYAGLRAAAEIFSGTDEAEVRARLQARRITHIVLTSDENFLRDYFQLLRPEAPAEEFERTFGYQLFFKQQLPLWLRMLPYRVPQELSRPDQRVQILQLVPEQTEPEALYHIAAAQLALGFPAKAETTLRLALEPLPAAARGTYALNAGQLCYQNGARAAAARLYRLGLAQHGPTTLAANLAWLLATDPDPTVRHAADALTLAQRCVAAAPTDFNNLHALAAALAENGRFPEAVAAAQRALELARLTGEAALLPQLARPLKSYEAGQPWRQ